MNQNLHFNILTFDWPEKPVTLYFSLINTDFCKRIHRTSFPNDIAKIFPEITKDKSEFIYTTFEYNKKEFIGLEINLSNENENLVKHYYKSQVKYFFQKIAKQIVRVGFIDDNQIWIKSKFGATDLFDVYEKFSIRVQIKTVSDFPELLLTYDGKSKVFKQNLKEAVKTFSPTDFSNIIIGKSVIKFSNFVEQKEPSYDEAYPVINKKISDLLDLPFDENPKENKYSIYHENIKKFVQYLMWRNDFIKLIPLHSSNFLKVSNASIAEIVDDSNNLAFFEGVKGRSPKTDFRNLKPYTGSPFKNIHLFFVYHSDDEDVKNTLKNYFQNGLRFYRGLNDYTGLLSHIDDSLEIKFTNKENPIPEIEQHFESNKYDTTKYKLFAFYLTPFTKEQTRKQPQRIYVQVKELLLNREIVSQSIEPQNVRLAGSEYIWSLTNMSIAILAKLKGIPWKLHKAWEDELIVGIGAFKHYEVGVQYLSSAFSFDNTGHFNSFEYFIKNDVDILAGCIEAKVREFATINGTPKRLIIHFYKKMNEVELNAIEDVLKQLELPKPIPIFIISINKTESNDIIAFDSDWKDLMPKSGTYISIGNKKYLLFNNARHGGFHNAKDGYPFPVKLSIDCNQKDQLQNIQVIQQLINQIYQFSRMYWKSLSQQNLPVTVKYPEMIAEIAPYFKEDTIPIYGRDTLWFL